MTRTFSPVLGAALLLAAAPLVAGTAKAPEASPRAASDRLVGTDPGPYVLRAPYERFRLDNGLTVILHKDDAQPRVAVNLWYHVGSSRERPGRTGFAHLFEHLMFEGSKNVPEGSFDRWLEAAGGDNNGSTTEDRTNYWEEVPPSALELALFLESDRMGFLLDTMTKERVDGQRDVVKNERRQSYENRPYGEADLVLPGLLWPNGHPYSWTVIGSMRDLTAASYDDVTHFFQTYYAPGNASLVIAGPIDVEQTKAWVQRWFSDVPKGRAVPPQEPMPASLSVEKAAVLEDDVQLPKLVLAWPTVPAFAHGDAALDAVAAVLGEGKQSRLHKRLVYELEMAQSVDVYHASQKLGGTFAVEIVARPGKSLREVLDVVDEEITHLQAEGPSERELGRTKNRFEASFFDAFERVRGFGGRADRMNLYAFLTGEPDGFAKDLARYRALTSADINNASVRFLTKGRVVLSVVPTGQQALAARPDNRAQKAGAP